MIHVDPGSRGPRPWPTSGCRCARVGHRALGALVRYVLEGRRTSREYVLHYTNASVILREDLGTPGPRGVFSGMGSGIEATTPTTWRYAAGTAGATGYQQDPTLQDPRCVYQVLRRHFARYTPELVERACGVPPNLFRELADAFCSASGPEKTASMCYALGWTQHSKGSQLIRTAAILQLLLGNIGRPGGGVLALRGHASIQGSTDIPTWSLPGYLVPLFGGPGYLATAWRSAANRPVGVPRPLSREPGEAAQKGTFGLRRLRLTGDHSLALGWRWRRKIGLFRGRQPRVAANAGFERRALKAQMDVVRDMVGAAASLNLRR